MRVDHGLIGDVCDAFGLLTRLPVPARRKPAARSVWAYPVVGLVVGAIGGAVDILCLRFGMAPMVAAFWAIAAQVMLTGGLHEDGLADTADGFGAGGEVARKLAIMRDSRIGAFGALALLLVVGVRIASIGAHPGWGAVSALIAAGASGRAAIVMLLACLPPARDDGLAAALRAPPIGSVSIAIAVAIAIDGFLGWRVVAAGVIACMVFHVAGRRQIGGYTGDTLGACEQCVEAAILSVAF